MKKIKAKTFGAFAVMLMATTCTQASVIYSHDFEPSGTNGGWATEVLSTSTDLHATLVTQMGDFYGVIYAEQTKAVTLGDTFTEGFTYEFSLDHFAREGQAPTFGGEDIRMQFGYDNGGGFTLLASQDFNATGTNPETVERRTISYEATTGSLGLGESIILRLIDFDASGHTSANQAGIDNIQVTAIPEPSSFALLAGLLGLTSVMLRRRR